MIDPRLNYICRLVNEWCINYDVPYEVVCDETDLQGIMLFKKNLQAVESLLEHLNLAITEGNVHVETKKVRGGTILSFSLEAISESRLNEIIAGAGEELEPMSFVDKINFAFEKPPALQEGQTGDFLKSATTSQETPSFFESAKNIVRGNQEDSKLFPRAKRLSDLIAKSEIGKNQESKGTDKSSKRASKGAELRYEERISKVFKAETSKSNPSGFNYALHEALNGVATATGAQPNDLFKTFARALRVLGQRMGLGPLQDRLKAQGISWKQSDDGQAIILTIKNAMTKADQPIARISHETLQNPSDFEIQLKNMLDFATGDAPGAFEQKEQEIADRKKAIGDIARAVQPQEQESDISQQMNMGVGQEQAAAQTAAMPKQPAPVAKQPAQQQPAM
tara:strand:+ start:10738 stop:11919 length:1182 start_codon:yes stop_codon:yes gene_type:complete